MKTETLNNKIVCRIFGETINLYDNENFTASINPYGDYNKGIPSENDRLNAELIVTAVNSCKEINNDNPLTVAKNISSLVKGLKSIAECEGMNVNASDAKGFIQIAKRLLQQIYEQ